MERSYINLVDLGDTHQQGITVECVIIGFFDGSLRILLNKYITFNKWMIPGGFVYKDESIDDAVSRHLKNRTGLQDIYMKQFYTFGEHDRINIEEHREILRGKEIPEEKASWFLNRSISISYYALVKYPEVKIYADPEDEIIRWFKVDELPELYADHKTIINKALSNIYFQIGFIPIGYELLPEKFTMPELRQVYEAFLGKELDRRNFQRKMLSIGLFEKLNETRRSGAHKAPILYTFNKKRYIEASKKGLQLIDWKFS